MQQSGAPNILFYSNRCQYCSDVLNTIIERNGKDLFLTICIERNIGRLPEFVDRVPMVYCKQEGQIICDENVMKYVEMILPNLPVAKPVPSQQNNQQPVDIQPFSLQHNMNYSDNFSFLGESQEEMQSKKAYTVLGIEDRMIPVPSDDDVGKSKFDTKVLDDYMKSRDLDTADFKQKMGNSLQPIVR